MSVRGKGVRTPTYICGLDCPRVIFSSGGSVTDIRSRAGEIPKTDLQALPSTAECHRLTYLVRLICQAALPAPPPSSDRTFEHVRGTC